MSSNYELTNWSTCEIVHGGASTIELRISRHSKVELRVIAIEVPDS